MLVSKGATLGNLVGYNDAEIGNALWPFIQKAVPADAAKLKTEATEIRVELESLSWELRKNGHDLFITGF